ncbi:UpxY family transcription antiterminator [Spirosoma validum]|uniref:UpxY family transcription antiterminator n=1 Tax=Spirosoma validum TaxID=2771355 RepID=A0A927AZH5_9BACT|nr:UpxY family transcription antiterminator [Spirosoma validum]MBD2752596.1 UpxY family transcription antiterminator [Spirosoma validum]
MPWFVIYTKSNTEKRVADDLRKRNITVYCPLIREKRKWSDRVKIVENPLFRSYCFVHVSDNERNQVFGVAGVVGYLHWLKKPAIVRDEEIEIIKKLLNDVDHAAIQLQQYSVSDKVRINSGVFMEQEGHVVAHQGKKLVLRLESLGVSISVDTGRTLVDKVGKALLE